MYGKYNLYFCGLYLLSHSTNKNRIFVSTDACNTCYDYLLITRTLLIFLLNLIGRERNFILKKQNKQQGTLFNCNTPLFSEALIWITH
jgi:hypothetical protein